MQKKKSKFKTADSPQDSRDETGKTRIRFPDILLVVICLAGACFSGAAFWQEYNNTLVKLDEEPVGTIVFKKRVAQRRFIDRNVWDRLQQSSPVYNGDIIRTIEQSEAIIIINDQITQLNLDERTMIQVYYDIQSGTKIDFSGGNLEVNSENKNIVITSGNSTITVNGSAQMNKSEEGLIISVTDGTASFDGTGITAGSILALDSGGEISKKPVIAVTSFGNSAYILGRAGDAVPVGFSWNSANFDSGTHVIVEIADYLNFNNIVQSADTAGVSSVTVHLKTGNYRWRAYPANAGSREPVSRLYPSGRLEVIAVSSVRLRSPSNGEELAFMNTGPALSAVPLSWSVTNSATAYLVEISANSDMSKPVVTRKVEENSVIQEGLNYGRWYWRITPVFPSTYKGSGTPAGSEAASAIGNFYLVRSVSPAGQQASRKTDIDLTLPPIIFGANTENWNDLDAEKKAGNDKTFSRAVLLLNSDSGLRLILKGYANPVTNPDDTAGRLREQNLELIPLSELRARAVRNYFITLGIDPERIEYYGFGGENPAAQWGDAANRWKNRRVELVLEE